MKTIAILAGFFLTAAHVFLPVSPAIAGGLKKRALSVTEFEATLPQTPDSMTACGMGMDVYTTEQFEYAKNIIVDYINNRHKWQDNEYTIYIFKVIPYASTVKFLVYHIDDEDITTAGGGKSLIIKFDMNKMTVIQELGTQ